MTKTKFFKLLFSFICIWQGGAMFVYVLSYDMETGSTFNFVELEALTGLATLSVTVALFGIVASLSTLDD